MAQRLDELFRMTDSNNRSVCAAEAALQAVREELATARRAQLPSVTVSAMLGYLGDGYGWGRDSSYSFPVPMPHLMDNLRLEASQVLYAGGALRAAVQMAQQQEALQRIKTEQVRQDVRMQVAGLYLDICIKTNMLRVYDSNINLTRQLVECIAQRHAQGAALLNDKTRYELQLANLRQQRLSLSNGVRIAQRRIASLLGMEEGREVVPVSVGENPAPDHLDAWLHRADSSALGLRMAQMGTELSRSAERMERSQMLPQLFLTAQDHIDGPVTIDITPYNIHYNYWFVGLGVKYDLSSLYKSRSRVAAARLRTQQSQLEQEATLLEVHNSVEEAFIRWEESMQNLSTQETNVVFAAQNYSVTSTRYDNAQALLTDMLDASTTKLSAELALENARIEVAFNYLKLKYICGIL